jgi:hypothetical protein
MQEATMGVDVGDQLPLFHVFEVVDRIANFIFQQRTASSSRF